jgi:hypothetical protein
LLRREQQRQWRVLWRIEPDRSTGSRSSASYSVELLWSNRAKD